MPPGGTGALTRTMDGWDGVDHDSDAGMAKSDGLSRMFMPRPSDAQKRPPDAHAANALKSSQTMLTQRKA
eukprot:scaffold39115_cov65-Phaeocystis_antarctica.AAC.8